MVGLQCGKGQRPKSTWLWPQAGAALIENCHHPTNSLLPTDLVQTTEGVHHPEKRGEITKFERKESKRCCVPYNLGLEHFFQKLKLNRIK